MHRVQIHGVLEMSLGPTTMEAYVKDEAAALRFAQALRGRLAVNFSATYDVHNGVQWVTYWTHDYAGRN